MCLLNIVECLKKYKWVVISLNFSIRLRQSLENFLPFPIQNLQLDIVCATGIKLKYEKFVDFVIIMNPKEKNLVGQG